MRERKNFFVDNNRLNKGYKTENGESYSSDRRAASLPDIAVLEQYEEVQPGIVKKMLEMAEKEQVHRHNMEALGAKVQQVAVRMGRIFAIFSVIAICYVALSFGMNNMLFEAMLFAAMGFGAIAISVYAGKCKNMRCGSRSEASHKNTHASRAQNSEEPANPAHAHNKGNYSNNYRRRRRNNSR